VPPLLLLFIIVFIVVPVFSDVEAIHMQFWDFAGIPVPFAHGITPPLQFEYTPPRIGQALSAYLAMLHSNREVAELRWPEVDARLTSLA
jgi:hypothetical protein